MRIMKKIFKSTRDIITVRPLRKWIGRKIAVRKLDLKFCESPKFDKYTTVQKKSILIVEPHFSHGECLPGHTKYFNDLGYNVDIIMRYENLAENPFTIYGKNMPRIFAGSLKMIKKWLGDKRISEYEYVFIASSIIWDFIPCVHFLDYLGFTPVAKNGCLFIDHAPNVFFKQYGEQKLVSQNRLFALSNLPEIPQLNPHYFGETQPHIKNDITKFVAIGRISPDARNYDTLIDGARKLIAMGKTDFIVNIIGNGKMDIPNDLEKHIVLLGRLDFPNMYSEVESADFIIAGLDPFCQDHNQYLVGTTTGNLQLSYGFKKPLIMNNLFGHHYDLTDANAVLYQDNDLADAMVRASNMPSDEYAAMRNQLGDAADIVYKRSLANLKSAVESNHETGIETNMLLMCKTYKKNIDEVKFLKASIDKYNIDKIPLCIVCPSDDLPLFQELVSGNENYKLIIMPEEPILEDDKIGNGYLDQQIVKLKFYKTGLCDFYLAIDSDSYFIRDFYVADFMYDNKTPYIVCHEGKSGTLLNSKFGNTSAMYKKEQFIKKFFGRTGKDYRFLTSPVMMSCEICHKLDSEIGAGYAIRICACEFAWHGEYMMKSGAAYKPTELFFEAIVYQKKYYWWKKIGITQKDISAQYLGIVMQDKLVKELKYE